MKEKIQQELEQVQAQLPHYTKKKKKGTKEEEKKRASRSMSTCVSRKMVSTDRVNIS